MSAEGWISIGLSGLLTIVTLFVAPDWVKNAAEINVWAMAAWTALFAAWFFSIGFGIGKAVTAKEKTAKERAIAESKKLRNWVIRLDASAKILLRSLSDKDHEDVTCFTIDDIDDLYAKLSFEDEPAVTFSHIETTNDERRVYRVRISNFGRQVVDEYGEILEEAKEHDKRD